MLHHGWKHDKWNKSIKKYVLWFHPYKILWDMLIAGAGKEIMESLINEYRVSILEDAKSPMEGL